METADEASTEPEADAPQNDDENDDGLVDAGLEPPAVPEEEPGQAPEPEDDDVPKLAAVLFSDQSNGRRSAAWLSENGYEVVVEIPTDRLSTDKHLRRAKKTVRDDRRGKLSLVVCGLDPWTDEYGNYAPYDEYMNPQVEVLTKAMTEWGLGKRVTAVMGYVGVATLPETGQWFNTGFAHMLESSGADCHVAAIEASHPDKFAAALELAAEGYPHYPETDTTGCVWVYPKRRSLLAERSTEDASEKYIDDIPVLDEDPYTDEPTEQQQPDEVDLAALGGSEDDGDEADVAEMLGDDVDADSVMDDDRSVEDLLGDAADEPADDDHEDKLRATVFVDAADLLSQEDVEIVKAVSLSQSELGGIASRVREMLAADQSSDTPDDSPDRGAAQAVPEPELAHPAEDTPSADDTPQEADDDRQPEDEESEDEGSEDEGHIDGPAADSGTASSAPVSEDPAVDDDPVDASDPAGQDDGAEEPETAPGGEAGEAEEGSHDVEAQTADPAEKAAEEAASEASDADAAPDEQPAGPGEDDADGMADGMAEDACAADVPEEPSADGSEDSRDDTPSTTDIDAESCDAPEDVAGHADDVPTGHEAPEEEDSYLRGLTDGRADAVSHFAVLMEGLEDRLVAALKDYGRSAQADDTSIVDGIKHAVSESNSAAVQSMSAVVQDALQRSSEIAARTALEAASDRPAAEDTAVAEAVSAAEASILARIDSLRTGDLELRLDGIRGSIDSLQRRSDPSSVIRAVGRALIAASVKDPDEEGELTMRSLLSRVDELSGELSHLKDRLDDPGT